LVQISPQSFSYRGHRQTHTHTHTDRQTHKPTPVNILPRFRGVWIGLMWTLKYLAEQYVTQHSFANQLIDSFANHYKRSSFLNGPYGITQAYIHLGLSWAYG